MEDVDVLIRKLEGIEEFVRDSVDAAIEIEEEAIVDLNRSQLQVQGVDAMGKGLGEYTPLSKTLRAEAGLQTEYVDLKFTGAFQDSLKIDKKSDTSYELIATDPKWTSTTDLQDRFPDAVGITKENEVVVTGIIIKKVDIDLRNYL